MQCHRVLVVMVVDIEEVKKLTLVEKFVHWLRIPYPWASLMLVSLATGPGALLARFLDTGSLEKAIPTWGVIAGEFSFTVGLFYILIMIRYLRMRVVRAENDLISLLPNERRDYVRAFGRISLWYPPILLALFLFLLFLNPFIDAFSTTTGFFQSTHLVMSTIANEVVYGTLLWVYLASIYGMYQLGKMPLRIKSYYEDTLLGLRPIGALSLSLTFAYFGAILVLTLAHISNPTYGPIQFTAVLLVLTFLGALMFFLPLTSIHRQMVQVKKRELVLLRRQFAQITRSADNSQDSIEGDENILKDIKKILIDSRKILELTAIESHVTRLSTWPFDLQIIGQLLAIFLAIIAGVIVRIIANMFGM